MIELRRKSGAYKHHSDGPKCHVIIRTNFVDALHYQMSVDMFNVAPVEAGFPGLIFNVQERGGSWHMLNNETEFVPAKNYDFVFLRYKCF